MFRAPGALTADPSRCQAGEAQVREEEWVRAVESLSCVRGSRRLGPSQLFLSIEQPGAVSL